MVRLPSVFRMNRPRTHRLTRVLARIVAVTAATAALGITAADLAGADPSAATWSKLRHCESSGNYQTVSSTGKYRGAYQFDQPTWESVGGAGRPNAASRSEQDYRALYLYRMRGWQPWECADSRHLGLRNDSDGRSKVAPSRGESAYIGGGGSSGGSGGSGSGGSGGSGGSSGGSGGSSGGSGGTGGSGGSDAPAGTTPEGLPKWDGKTYFKGDCAPAIKTFQDQLNKAGSTYKFKATGCYQERTFDAVVKLQKDNGINPSGRLGSATWYAAWNGKGFSGQNLYTVPAKAGKWDGKVYFKGDCSASLRTIQLRLNKIGAEPTFKGTSCYDENTFAAIVKLQKANGINPSGRLGPKTWEAAWNGKSLT